MFLVEEDRYIYAANVVCANQNIKKSGYSSLKQNPFVQKGKQIFWNPIAVQKYPDETKLRELQEKLEDATKYLAIDMQEGLYLVSRYEKKPFRG